MMRIAGINLPKEKKIGVALTYLYGIGPTLAIKILDQAKVDLNIRTKDLTSEQEDKVRALVEKNFKVEGDLRREVMSNVKRLKDIKCYRGIRHMKHLPVHGQRTKTNSRTVRGNVRKTTGSGKKTAGLKT
ncbi:MAG: 30S ribosomal protein S13 [Patescibacteria group bacterium]